MRNLATRLQRLEQQRPHHSLLIRWYGPSGQDAPQAQVWGEAVLSALQPVPAGTVLVWVDDDHIAFHVPTHGDPLALHCWCGTVHVFPV